MGLIKKRFQKSDVFQLAKVGKVDRVKNSSLFSNKISYHYLEVKQISLNIYHAYLKLSLIKKDKKTILFYFHYNDPENGFPDP